MTMKRFETNMRLVIDTEKKYGARVLNAEEVVDLLNELHEENKQLHRVVAENEKENKELREEVIALRHIAENIQRIKSIWGLLSKELKYR